MIDAIELALAKSSDRLRFSANLHPHATRAVFAGTEESLSNAKLLRILRPKSVGGVIGRDTREARNLRSTGAERGLKIDRIKMYLLALLESGAIGKEDAVRAWTYALIHESSRLSVAEARKKYSVVNLDAVKTWPNQGNDLLNRCYEILSEKVRSGFEKSANDVDRNIPHSEQRAFLDYAAGVVIDAMHQSIPPWDALNNLLSKVYPEINSYEFD